MAYLGKKERGTVWQRWQRHIVYAREMVKYVGWEISDMWGESCGEKGRTEFTTEGGRECGAKVGEGEESYR